MRKIHICQIDGKCPGTYGGKHPVSWKDITKLKGEKLRRLRQKIQMVFQDPGTAFYPKMKVMDIVTEPLMNFRRIRKSEKEEKAKELLRMVELPEEYIYRFPAQYERRSKAKGRNCTGIGVRTRDHCM